MTRTVIALFDNFTQANDAVRDLVNGGVTRDDISILASDQKGEYSQYVGSAPQSAADTGAASGAGVGAGIGAVIGGLAGILVGLGALTIPGIGPVLAAGPLAAALSGLAGAGAGAVAGGITGGLIGALVDLGVPEENAQYFAEGIRRGGTLVTVRTPDEMSGRVRDILNRHNPVDMNERVSQWRESGWTGFETSSEPRMTEGRYGGTMADMPADRPTTSTEHLDSNVDIYSSEEQRMEDARMGMADTGNTTTERRQDWDTTGTTSSTSMTSGYEYQDYPVYNESFRNHFTNSMYANTYTYDQYEPAYRYGYDLATNERYRDRDWTDVEGDARTYWDERNPGTWERIKDSVRHAWEEVKNTAR